MSQGMEQESFGDYVLTHKLGQGGMATVFRGIRSGPMGFAKEVAIKRLHTQLTDNDGVLKSLINEARIGGQLKHPNIVEVYEFNKVAEQYYLAMEFVDGWTLDRVIKLSQDYDLQMPPAVVLDVVIQICEGLHYAHTVESLEGQEVRLVHRDLKPANIILSKGGVAKVMDFGIAKAETNLFKTTLADTTKGTPHYMSPEQVAGDPNLAATSDIFALGTVLFELLSGQLLFGGDSLMAVLFAVAKADVEERLENLDLEIPGISPILSRCLSKDPDDRYQTAEELGQAVKSLRRTMRSEHDVQSYLYAVREAMLGETQRFERPQADEIQFASLVMEDGAKLARDPAAIEEARAAADAAIGEFNRGRGDEPGPTLITKADKSLAPGAVRAKEQADYEGTRVYTSADTPEAKRRRLVAIVALLVLVGVAGVAGILLWPATEPTVQRPEPTPTAVAELPPIEAPEAPEATPTEVAEAPKATPKPRSTPKPRATPKPTPKATAEATPTPRKTPAVAAATPPPPKATPTPEPVAVVTGKGTLRAKGCKPYAEIWIDGKNTGKKTPLMGLTIPAGKHTVELRSPELGTKVSRRFEMEPDGVVVLPGYNFETESWIQ